MTHERDPHATDEAVLTPAHTAAQVAPLIDALRLTIVRGIMSRAVSDWLAADAAVSPPGAQVFALLRGALTGRSLALDGVRATVRYLPRAQTDASLEELQARDLATVTDGELRLTGRGVELQRRLADITCDVVAGLWGHVPDATAELEKLTNRALAHVAADDSPAFRVLFPPFDPPSSTSASRLAERLACLRFHRADAHAAAWQAAGLTLEEVVSRDGALPADVEDETNLRASAPYEALTPAERQDFVAGLHSLRRSSTPTW